MSSKSGNNRFCIIDYLSCLFVKQTCVLSEKINFFCLLDSFLLFLLLKEDKVGYEALL